MWRATVLVLIAMSAAANEQITIPFHHPFHRGLAAVNIGEKWGYIDTAGRIVIPAHYGAAATPCDDGTLIVDDAILLDRRGRILMITRAPLKSCFTNGLAISGPDPVTYFIGRDGRRAFVFDHSEPFTEGVAAVELEDGSWGYIRQDGSIAIPPRFEWALPFREGLALVYLAGHQFAFIDHSGSFVIGPRQGAASDFHDGRAVTSQGVVDRGGRVVTATFELVRDFSNGYAGVCEKRKCGFIDRAGRIAIALQFDSVGDFAEGLAPAKLGGKWGYVDSRGRWAIRPRFTEADELSEGLAAVDLGQSEIAWIDRRGRVVIRLADVAARFETQDEKERLSRVERESRPYADPFEKTTPDELLSRVFQDGDAAALPALFARLTAPDIARPVAAMPREVAPPFPVATLAVTTHAKSSVSGFVRDGEARLHVLTTERTGIDLTMMEAWRDGDRWRRATLSAGPDRQVLGMLPSGGGTLRLIESLGAKKEVTERRWTAAEGWSDPKTLLAGDDQTFFESVAVRENGTVYILFSRADSMRLATVAPSGKMTEETLPLFRSDYAYPWLSLHEDRVRVYLLALVEATSEDVIVLDAVDRHEGGWSRPRRIAISNEDPAILQNGEVVFTPMRHCEPVQGTPSICLAGGSLEDGDGVDVAGGEVPIAALANGDALFLVKASPRGSMAVRIYSGGALSSPRLVVHDGIAEVAFVDRSAEESSYRVVSAPLSELEWTPLSELLLRSMAGQTLGEREYATIASLLVERGWQLEREHHAPAAIAVYERVGRDPFQYGYDDRYGVLCDTFRELPACGPPGGHP